MVIKSDREWQFLVNAINQGIDSHLEAISVEQNGNKLAILDSDSLHTLLRRLIETDDYEDEGAIDLASCILYTLNIEWI